MELLWLILSIIFMVFLAFMFWYMVYLFFKKLWEEYFQPCWESLLSGEKESFKVTSDLLSDKAVKVNVYLHRTSYCLLSMGIIFLPGYFFSEFLSKKEIGIAVLSGIVGYPILYFLLVFPFGIPLIYFTSIGVTWLLYLPFFSSQPKEVNPYIPFSIIELQEMLPVEIWCDNEKGKKILYGRLVERYERSGDFLLKDDGSKFSIGLFKQNLEDGFFYNEKEPVRKLYLKKES